MEDYIFIIIAIILSALGAVNRNKKKRIAQMENSDNSNREPSFFEKQFSDAFFDEEDDFDPVFSEQIVTEPVIKEPEKKPQPEPFVKIKKPAEKEKIVEETEEETKIDSIMKDFSLKKAVIYSEILERKY